MLRQRLAELEAPDYIEPSPATVGEYLRSWHEQARHHISPRAHESAGFILERHIIPDLGHHKLAALRASHLEAYYAAKLDAGLAPGSVRKHHSIVHSALARARRLDLIRVNPADAAQPPRVRSTEMMALSAEEVASVLRAAEGTPLHLPLMLSFATGLRRGEALGLHWSDINLDAATLAVVRTLQIAYGQVHEKQPKSARSRRTISLPRCLVSALREHRAEQATRTLAGEPGWTDSEYVLAAPGGGPWNPSTFDHCWRRFRKRQGFTMRWHDTRHTHASLMLAAGIHVKIVSERLGHASIAITLDTYSHVLPALERQAAEQIDEGLQLALG